MKKYSRTRKDVIQDAWMIFFSIIAFLLVIVLPILNLADVTLQDIINYFK